ncbi:MAG: hypothetical protein P1U63_07680 [Coxiellaceae bacterium]|nr:hypothetical protein [Coxiellaceae bacterium]
MRGPADAISIGDLEQSVMASSVGAVQPSADALEQRARGIILNAYEGGVGAKQWQQDLDATIKSRKKQLPNSTQWALWSWHAAATLLCCTAATFIAGIPDNFTDYSKNSALNWAVDLATYSMFVTVLPIVHHKMNLFYANHIISAQRNEEYDPMLPTGARVTAEETPAENLTKLSELKLFKSKMTHMAYFKQIAATHVWNYREKLTYSNSTTYAEMMVQKAYDSSLGKTAVLTLLPILMAKMPGATEQTGKFRGGNFGWEIAASWLVLTFHDAIREYLVAPVATKAAQGFYLLCSAVSALGSSAYCCFGAEDGGPRAQPNSYNARVGAALKDLEWEEGGDSLSDAKADDRDDGNVTPALGL